MTLCQWRKVIHFPQEAGFKAKSPSSLEHAEFCDSASSGVMRRPRSGQQGAQPRTWSQKAVG